jgi:hypothetical protein
MKTACVWNETKRRRGEACVWNETKRRRGEAAMSHILRTRCVHFKALTTAVSTDVEALTAILVAQLCLRSLKGSKTSTQSRTAHGHPWLCCSHVTKTVFSGLCIAVCSSDPPYRANTCLGAPCSQKARGSNPDNSGSVSIAPLLRLLNTSQTRFSRRF